MNAFSERTLELFHKARACDDESDAEAFGTAGSREEGVLFRFALWIRKGKITKASAKTFGCVAAIASGYALSEMVRGKSLE